MNYRCCFSTHYPKYKEKAEIWKEYFDKLLNTEKPKELIKKGNKEISEVEVSL